LTRAPSKKKLILLGMNSFLFWDELVSSKMRSFLSWDELVSPQDEVLRSCAQEMKFSRLMWLRDENNAKRRFVMGQSRVSRLLSRTDEI